MNTDKKPNNPPSRRPEPPRFTQKQRNSRGRSANSLKNLRPFRRGKSGNPGGTPKGTPKISTALKRFLAMSPEEWRAYEPKNSAEQIAYRSEVRHGG
jgi:hypothetical protein